MFIKHFMKEQKEINIEEKSKEKVDLDSLLDKIRKKTKIKTIIPTKFGTEVVFFNSKDAEEVSKIVDSKLDGNSIFISN